MAKRKLCFVVLSVLLVSVLGVAPVLADPPVGTTPTIDGTIGADWANSGTTYPNGTLLSDDGDADSVWGGTNDIHEIYVNWDANNVYFGLDYDVDGNGVILYLDFGTSAGITDFDSPTDYAWGDDAGPYNGAWPRNVSFPGTNGIDAFYANWGGASGNMYVADGSTNSTDVTASCTVASGNVSGTNYQSEISCPWSVFGFATPIYPTGGADAIPDINVLAAIVGGDDYSLPDVAPDGADVHGDGSETTVASGDFANIGIGPNAVTLSTFTVGTKAPALLVGSVLLLGAVIVWSRRRA